MGECTVVTMLRAGSLKNLGFSFSSKDRVLLPLALRLAQPHIQRLSPLRKEPSSLKQHVRRATA